MCVYICIHTFLSQMQLIYCVLLLCYYIRIFRWYVYLDKTVPLYVKITHRM
jgi:hypothetical protein